MELVRLLAPTDQIPVYIEGEAVGFAAPLKVVDRTQARLWKKERKGYFVSHGKAFVICREPVAEPEAREKLLETGKAFRGLRTYDESCSVQPRTMNDYVDGRRTARIAVDFWRGFTESPHRR